MTEAITHRTSGLYTDAATRDRIMEQLVRWEEENVVYEEVFDYMDKQLEEPTVDLLNSILILAQLSLMQTGAFMLAQQQKMETQLHRIKELKKEYYDFIELNSQINEEEAKTFASLQLPTKEKNFKQWFHLIERFYNKAFDATQKQEDEFYEVVENFYGQSGLYETDTHLERMISALDNINFHVSGKSGYEFYKNLERFVSRLMFGMAAKTVMPGTVNVAKGIFEIKNAFAIYLTELHDASKKQMQAVIAREEGEFNLTMSVLQDVVSDFGQQYLRTIRRIMENYYNAMLNIIERVPV